MKGWLLLSALAVTLVAAGVGAAPLKADSDKPVVFWPPAIAVLGSTPYPRRDGNRVLYVTSLKQAHRVGWARIGLPIDYDPDFSSESFKKYGILAIFYKGQSAGFGAGFDPKIEFIEESAAGDLSAKVAVACYNATSCGEAKPDPTHPWGMLILVWIDKRSLLTPPKTVHVTTASA